MKKLILITIVCLAALTFSCTKERPLCCAMPDSPYIYAVKNNVNWQGAPLAEKITNDSIAIIGSQTKERLILRIKTKLEGTYTLTGNQGNYFTTVGQDVITSEYFLDDAATNTVTISKYDNAKDLITGTYSVTLKKATRFSDPAIPATVKFLNGKFMIRITQ